MQRQPFAVRLEASAGPVCHRSPRHSSAIAAIFTRIGGAYRPGRDQLGRSVMPRTLTSHIIGRGIPESSLERANQPVRGPNAGAVGSRQRRTRGGEKSMTLGRSERSAQLGYQQFNVVRCCHDRPPVEWCWPYRDLSVMGQTPPQIPPAGAFCYFKIPASALESHRKPVISSPRPQRHESLRAFSCTFAGDAPDDAPRRRRAAVHA